jgi:ATP-binding cassette, subfamily D (ALD), member 3
MNKAGFKAALFKYFTALPAVRTSIFDAICLFIFVFFCCLQITVVNNILKWSLGELKLRFRTNLSQHLYTQYLKYVFFFVLYESIIFLTSSIIIYRGFTYYKMSNLDNRIANADQLLTTDIDKFCESVTDLYSNISKPILDIMIYVYRLTTNLGGQVRAKQIVVQQEVVIHIFFCFLLLLDSSHYDVVLVCVGIIFNTFT